MERYVLVFALDGKVKKGMVCLTGFHFFFFCLVAVLMNGITSEQMSVTSYCT